MADQRQFGRARRARGRVRRQHDDSGPTRHDDHELPAGAQRKEEPRDSGTAIRPPEVAVAESRHGRFGRDLAAGRGANVGGGNELAVAPPAESEVELAELREVAWV